jgi:hypothetical protein
MPSAKTRPHSKVALQAEALMERKLIAYNGTGAHYLRGFRTGSGRQIAINRVNQAINVWSEPVHERCPASLQTMRKKRYLASQPRISSLEHNAPRLYAGNVADYWQFPTLGDLDAFLDWYKTL